MRRRIRSAAPVHRHSLPQVLVDGMLVALAYFLAFRLRFESAVPGRYQTLLDDTIVWVVPVTLVVLAAFGAYERLWTFITQRDYEAVAKGVLVATILIVGLVALIHPVNLRAFTEQVPYHHWVHVHGHRVLRIAYHEHSIPATAVTLPSSVIAGFFLAALVLLGGARFAVHLVAEGRVRSFRVSKNAREVLIVGGGDGGRLVVRELVRNPELRMRPVGFVDDDPRKLGTKDEHGLKVIGTTEAADFARVLDEVEPDEVVIAIPSASGTMRARVVMACRRRGIPVRTMPTVFELLRDGAGQMRLASQLREVRVEDMLGREPVRMELERVGAYLAERVVLVTGAGGSIGSELCRQISRVGPRKLVLVDHAEDNLFEVLRELEEERHVKTAVPVLADCKEEERMREVLGEHHPAVVFHAAAYKHVAMMELNAVEAVRNNALATRVMARTAAALGVEIFVLVSTDKAVKPATVMGASKALAEWALEAQAAKSPGTRYATVRFGNVLGSSGSVVPIFRRQIAAGGPVTVTHPRMTRYFMTIPEAVQLIIRAGSLGRSARPGHSLANAGHSPANAGHNPANAGNAAATTNRVATTDHGATTYVLDMGDPIRIVDLAETMIHLSGLEPGQDIAIEFIGQRPGEKFHEDLFNPYERLQPTPVERIIRAERDRLDPEWVDAIFDNINLLVLEGDAAALAEHVSKLDADRGVLPLDPAARVGP